jgi:hypothetical protein
MEALDNIQQLIEASDDISTTEEGSGYIWPLRRFSNISTANGGLYIVGSLFSISWMPNDHILVADSI